MPPLPVQRRQDARESGVGLVPIVNSLAPNEHSKSIEQELQEVEAETNNDEEKVAGLTLSKTLSRKEIVTSKARLVALVLTLTGASFLNVSLSKSKLSVEARLWRLLA
jgi:hypothetical protein